MEYKLKFVNDNYKPWILHGKKRVNINRRNRDEVMKGYTDTVYSWRISRYVSEDTIDIFGHGQGPSQTTGKLYVDGVLHELNTDYCFDFDYEPAENDILSTVFHYRNPVIMGMARPYFFSGEILLRYNGKEWERGWRFREIYEEIHRGILYITPK